MISKSQAKTFNRMLNSSKVVGGMKGKVALKVYNQKGELVDIVNMWQGYDVDDIMFNTSLDTAKKIMAHVMAGDVNYKLARVAFGNCGHNFDNTKQKIDPTPADVELKALELIRKSLEDDNIDDYTYTYNDVEHRIAYIEKDITAANISFGPDGKEFVVEVPITFNDFNLRQGADQSDEKSLFVDSIAKYDLIMSDGTLAKHRNIDSDGNIVDDGNYTEILKTTDSDDNTVYRFKNGLNSDGEVDTDNGGIRPQEVSEILLCANITGTGTAADPYEKLASSRITSGLLVFPEGFNFVYQWTLSWNLVD